MEENERKMIYTTANSILEKTNYSISNLRLNRLLYYVYGVYLATQNQRPWSEQTEAWNYGPIFPSIYKKFKIYGSKRIKYPILGVDFNNDIDGIIDEVLKTFNHLTDTELIARTHNDKSPWNQYYEPKKQHIIPDRVISEYFKAYIIKERVA
jgi:uncharacterized phage-associated protein